MTSWGTSYFESKEAAVKYYTPYHYSDTAAAVERKLAGGEIHIGMPKPKLGERVYLNHQEGRYLIEDPGYIAMLKAEGWQVWMRESAIGPTQYCYVTDGTRIAYVQWSDHQPKVSTVHIPNQATGTGFMFADTITPETIREAMNTVAPSWARGCERYSVRKYESWAKFHQSNRFNSELKEV